MNMGSVFNAALLRAFIISVLLAAAEVGNALAASGSDREIIAIAIRVFAQAMVLRMGEGVYDMSRARVGDVHRSDVGSTEVITRTSVPTTPPEPSTTTTTVVTTNPDDKPPSA